MIQTRMTGANKRMVVSNCQTIACPSETSSSSRPFFFALQPPSPPQNSSKPISSIFNSIGPQRPPVRLGRRTSNGAHGPVKSLCLTKPPSPDKLEANMFVSLVVVRAGAFVSVSRLFKKKRNVHVL